MTDFGNNVYFNSGILKPDSSPDFSVDNPITEFTDGKLRYIPSSKYQVKSSESSIYFASDELTPRKVAIKVLNHPFNEIVQDWGVSITHGELLWREFVLQHKLYASGINVPQPLDFTYHVDVPERTPIFYPALVMERIYGHSLDVKIVIDETFGMEQVFDVMYEFAASLDQAHKMGVIHRDIKPSNIILADPPSTRKTYTLDWMNSNVVLDKLPMRKASNGFSAPELYYSQIPASVNDDRFSLIASIYFLLTGQVLFEFDDSMKVKINRVKDSPFASRWTPQEWERIDSIFVDALFSASPFYKENYSMKDTVTVMESLVREIE